MEAFMVLSALAVLTVIDPMLAFVGLFWLYIFKGD